VVGYQDGKDKHGGNSLEHGLHGSFGVILILSFRGSRFDSQEQLISENLKGVGGRFDSASVGADHTESVAMRLEGSVDLSDSGNEDGGRRGLLQQDDSLVSDRAFHEKVETHVATYSCGSDRLVVNRYNSTQVRWDTGA